MLIVFDGKEGLGTDEFKAWRDTYDYGFYINRKSEIDYMLHRAPCEHAKLHDDRMSLTNNVKIAALTVGELETWFRTNGMGKLKDCSSCCPHHEIAPWDKP